MLNPVLVDWMLVVVDIGVIVIVKPAQRVASKTLRWLMMLAEIESRTDAACVGCDMNMKLFVMVE